MKIEFNDIMNKFNTGLITRKQVLGFVQCGVITFEDYREIVDGWHRPARNKSRTDIYELDVRRAPKTIDRARSKDTDWYDWCALLENGTLTFGSEQGNYAGGTTTAYYFSEYYPDACPGEYVYDDFIPLSYWGDVVHILKHLREYDHDYFQSIVDMCKRNDSGTVMGLIEKIEEGIL